MPISQDRIINLITAFDDLESHYLNHLRQIQAIHQSLGLHDGLISLAHEDTLTLDFDAAYYKMRRAYGVLYEATTPTTEPYNAKLAVERERIHFNIKAKYNQASARRQKLKRAERAEGEQQS